MSNLKTYENPKSVDVYFKLQTLFKPEQTFLKMLQHNLGGMKMLDIGVGAGRTTAHFAGLVHEYTGIDYSDSMINACKNRFKDRPEYKFITCDVRNLQIFQDNQFDFVLFSFNGLDYISAGDRTVALKEIRRVIKSDGYFIFSTHNLQSLKELYQIQFTFHPIHLARSIIKHIRVLFHNGMMDKYVSRKFVIINDGAHGFGLKTFYIRPLEQIELLKSSGFKDIKLFSAEDGKEIQDTDYQGIEEVWFYYFCRVSK